MSEGSRAPAREWLFANLRQGRSRFDRFDFETVRYFGFDVASIFRARNPFWTKLVVTCFGFDRFDNVSVLF